MKSGFFLKIAWNNIKKNYRFFVPHILTEMGLLASFYIVFTIAKDERLTEMRGGDYLPIFMTIGTWVMVLLSVILILYTNSFLMRQRKHEYGLYNILGMEKKHVARVMFHETFICGITAILLGLGLGVLLYKLCSLLVCSLFQTDIVLGFYFITPRTLLPSAAFFFGLNLLAYLIDLISLKKLNPVELLSSKSTGEKEPKIKWVFLLIGLITLGAGYYLAITVESPLEAIILFFVAVFLVIIGTYCLFVSGSIFVLKLLKNNKHYYYQKNHFSSVSGLLYRMKQNAVGLASICILATGVLVMVSSTVSLYSGMQDSLSINYPNDLFLYSKIWDEDGTITDVPNEVMADIAKKSAEECDLQIESISEQQFLMVSYLFEKDGQYLYSPKELDEKAFFQDISKLTTIIYFSNDEYEKLTGIHFDLQDDELVISRIFADMDSVKTPSGDLRLHGETFHIKEEMTSFPISLRGMNSVSNAYGIICANDQVLAHIAELQERDFGENASEFTRQVAVSFADVDAFYEKSSVYKSTIRTSLLAYLSQFPGAEERAGLMYDSVADAKEAVLGMYGTFLFLGIILGIVCLFATALIIYYKQISEGYEDRERFQIMKKVGMSDQEIQKTIRTQTLLVFFLPLLTAGIHIIFAFPMISKLLKILLLSSVDLFVLCTIISFLAFAVVYVFIYLQTSKTYYRIVH